VQWTVQPGSIDSVEVWLSSDNGATFPTLLGTQLENSGTMTLPGLTTVGNQFRVRVRTRNGPTNADAVMTGPFTVRPAAMSLNGAGGCYDHVFMSWIAPGNDGNPGTSGTALEYDLRWSTGAITEVNFSGATRIATNPPLPANSMEQYLVSVPRCSARRYYAVKVRGAANIWSAMSNTSNVGPACPHWPVQCWDEIERATPDETAMIPKVIELSLPGPSPARESSMPVHFGVPTSQRGANYEIAVFDLVGRRIATLGRGPAIPGYHALNWNMASQDGDRVRPGMYFVRLRLGEATLTRRIIAIR
jgi:hypothetical protein